MSMSEYVYVCCSTQGMCSLELYFGLYLATINMHLRFGYIAVYHHHTYAKHVDASLYFVQTNEFSSP